MAHSTVDLLEIRASTRLGITTETDMEVTIDRLINQSIFVYTKCELEAPRAMSFLSQCLLASVPLYRTRRSGLMEEWGVHYTPLHPCDFRTLFYHRSGHLQNPRINFVVLHISPFLSAHSAFNGVNIIISTPPLCDLLVNIRYHTSELSCKMRVQFRNFQV